MTDNKSRIYQTIKSILPEHISENYSNFVGFLKQYYISQEFQGGVVDISRTIDSYKRPDIYTNEVIDGKTTLTADITTQTKEIAVESTFGWPEEYGLIKIDNEIIYYSGITTNTFTGCVRGFSGIDALKSTGNSEKVNFKTTTATDHKNGSTVTNLNALIAQELFKKYKYLFAPGIGDRTIADGVDKNNLLKQIRNFYQSKGTNESVKILFRILFSQEADVIKPQEYLFSSSDSEYDIVERLVCRCLSGDPTKIKGGVLIQEEESTNVDIKYASGSITDVESLSYNVNLSGKDIIKAGKDETNVPYYLISLSSGYNRDINTNGTIEGNFTITPKTLTTQSYSRGDVRTISVDSTISFPESGFFFIEDGVQSIRVGYRTKNINQFLECYSPEPGREILPSNFTDGSIVRGIHSVFSYENNDTSKKVEFVITGVLGNYESGGITKLIGAVKSSGLNVTGFVNGSGYVIGSNSIFGTGVISGTNTSLDGTKVNGKIIGTIEDRKIKGLISNTGIGILDGAEFVGEFLESSSVPINLADNDPIRIKSIGKIEDPKNYHFSSWVYNVSNRSRVKTIDAANQNSVKLTSFDDHQMILEDKAELIDVLTNKVYAEGTVTFINNEKTITFDMPSDGIDNSKEWDIRRKILFGSTNNRDHIFSDLDTLISNVQNTYSDNNNFVYVSSESIPSYQITTGKNIREFVPNNVNDSRIEIPDHGFFSGDFVFYTPKDRTEPLVIGFGEFDVTYPPLAGINTGFYYVIRYDSNTLGLSLTRNGVRSNSFVNITGNRSATDFHQLIPGNLAGKSIKGQKLFKAFPLKKEFSLDPKITEHGALGMFVNGVEILNYKSPQRIHYGKIDNIEVLNGGKNYDAVNIPNISIVDNNGFGAIARPSINGKVVGIALTDVGFDIIGEPKISLTGGNGSGCVLNAKLSKISHEIFFDAGVTGYVSVGSTISIIDTVNDKFRIPSFHKFRNGDEVVYNSFGNTPIRISSGISTQLINNAFYYVSVVSATEFKLHGKRDDALNNINSIDIVGFGTGRQSFKSTSAKQIISEIVVVNPGKNYRSKERIVDTDHIISGAVVGINTIDHLINISNHDYEDKDVLTYKSNATPINGLVSEEKYLVTVYDKNNFRLSKIGINTESYYKYYDEKKYIKFLGIGSGKHTFNYPPIELKIDVESNIPLNYGGSAYGDPIVRGEITTISILNGGKNYGSEENVIDLDTSFVPFPKINVDSGSRAVVEPVIQNGEIKYVIIKDPGSGYTSPPDLILNNYGEGIGANLVSVVKDGKLDSIVVVFGGLGYSESTTIVVNPIGSDCVLKPSIQTWTINLFERNKNRFSDDDGFIIQSTDVDLGLKYGSLYAPRKLRKILKTNGGFGKNSDLEIDPNKKVETDRSGDNEHSPIIGWAYDGNPIYGPYGYVTNIGGGTKLMTSGYKQIVTIGTNRKDGPDTDLFPPGLLVEDFEYQGTGDLDEHNGRFCVTPEFPNGTYAYFCTFSPDIKGSNTRFSGFKEPVFPYVIGNTYYSEPVRENLKYDLNQQSPELNKLNIVRNTYPYKFGKSNSVYEYCIQPQNKTEIECKISKTSVGSIDAVTVLNKGTGYKIGDSVVVDMANTGSSIPVSLDVGSLMGVGISSVSYKQTNFNDVNISYSSNVLTGVCTQPHELKTNDIIEIYNTSLEYKTFEGFNKISVPTVSSQLRVSLANTSVTGITTSIYLNSSVLPFNNVSDNVVGIGSEEFEVLDINEKENSLYVKRLYRNTVGSSHTSGENVILKSRLFKCYTEKALSSTFLDDKIKKFNFIPKQTVGVGTVGISTFLTYISLGNVVDREVKLQSIYVPNHSLKTGEKLLYSCDEGSSIGVSTNVENNVLFNLQNNSIVYAINFGKDFVGLSTSPIGIGSEGSFIGINTSQTPYPLYFKNFGSGDNHSLETIKTISKCNVIKHDAVFNCLDSHLLEDDDRLQIDIKSKIEQKHYEVEYNNHIRKLIINPKQFTGLDIDLENNTINIPNHQFKTGDEVVYESSSVANPLRNNEIYYVVRISDNFIKLLEHYYDTQLFNPQNISFTSNGGNATTHRLSLVNPKLDVYKYESVGFGVSHQSLTNLDLKFFKDSDFSTSFDSTETTSESEILRVGRPGFDSNALVTLKLNKNYPTIFYYQLVPSNVELIKINKEFDKLNILPNRYVKNPNTNKVEIIESSYNKIFNIKKLTDKEFSVNLTQIPEKNYYNFDQLSSNNYYVLSSQTYEGPIQNINILQYGKNLKATPKFISIKSKNGSNADLLISGKNIGKIKKVNIGTIGFEFNSDKTLKPVADIPTVLQLDEFYKLQSINVKYGGQNYLRAPDIIFYNRETDAINSEIIAFANLDGSSVSSVTLINGGFGLSKTNITPICLNNDNGINVINASYNTTSEIATLTLQTPSEGFTANNFPFEVGDVVFVEGVKIVDGTGSGYNSNNYKYSYFTIETINPNVGVADQATISYKIAGITTCGLFDTSFGRVVKESLLPQFELNYIEGNESEVFLKNEIITFPQGSASVLENFGWDGNTLTLRVNKLDGKLNVNDLIKSKSTGAIAKIKNVDSSEGFYQVSEMSTNARGSLKETGKTGNSFQRLHDNNYYQKFSYSIKSEVNIAGWDEQVDSLIHTAGYKKFSDLNVLSSSLPNVAGSASTIVSIIDLSSIQDVERIPDYDLVTEDYIGSCSQNIFFNGKQLTDFFRSEKNRVIVIDDVSGEFRSNADNFVYTIIDSFYGNTVRSCKYIIQFYDPRKKQYELAEFLLVHNNFDVYINDYTGTFNNLPFGTLNAFVERGFIEVRFTPFDQNTNIYIKVYRIGLRDDLTTSDTVEVGFIDRISISQNIVLEPSVPVQIVGFDSNKYTSFNFIAQVGTATSNYLIPVGSKDYLSVEGNILVEHDKDIIYSDYGSVHTFRDLGEFNSILNPITGKVDINFSLNVGIATTTASVRLYAVGVTTETISGFTTYITPNPDDGNGSVKVRSSYIENSAFTQIPSPEVLIVSNDKREYRSVKYFIEVKNENNDIGTLTLNCIHDGTNAYVGRYGYTYFDEDVLGEFDVKIFNDELRLIHIPPYNIQTKVKVYSEEFEIGNGIGYTTFGSTDILVGDYVYEDRINRYRYSFALKHNTDSIFSKKIEPVGVATTSSNITFFKESGEADDHFFVTGEELKYSYAGISTERISITPISVAGIGNTDKLPDTVFAIKDTENTIRLAKSKSDALSGIALTITDVYLSNDPIEERQSLDAIEPNKRTIIQIDNIIQQPLTWTNISYSLNETIGGGTTTFSLSGITSIINGDIVKIDDEYMYVEGTNFPRVNDIIVRRGWMGTNLNFDSFHGIGSTVRLYKGDYNIVKDIIYFKDAPYGSNTVGSDFLSKSNIRANSSFQGRFFQKSSYDNNVIFDDISTQFTGIGRTFVLSVEGKPISGIALSESNSVVLLNNIFQKPSVDYEVDEIVGVSTNIIFNGRTDVLTGNRIISQLDVNKNDIPRGGIIISVGSSQGYGYQPLIKASGIATVSVAGTILGVNIGTSYYSPGAGYTNYTFPGSGYTQQIVAIQFDDPENNGNGASGYGVINSGIVTNVIITSGGIGYTTTNPPKVTFDSPIGYINLPLTGSSTGIGASVSVVVGQGSSVIDFNIVNNGYNYKIGDVLTPVGIPTNQNLPSFEPFEIIVTNVWYDKFSSWNVGNLELLVDISPKFDGIRRSFALERQGDVGVEPLSIEKGDYGAIDLASNLLVLLDGVLQQPRKDYNFNGGTVITFTEPPRKTYSCLIFFYRGEPGDTVFQDIDPPIEVGDELQLYKAGTQLFQEKEDKRTVVGINSSNSAKTSVYCGLGQSKDESTLRPVHLIRQKKDIYNLGEYESKKRLISEPNIRPTSNLIRSITASDAVLYLDSISENFNYDLRPSNGVKIISQDNDFEVDYINNISVSGGYGVIVGVGTSSTGINTTTPMVEFTLIKTEEIGTISSGIESGVYFTVSNSNVGTGLTSIEIEDGSQKIIGIGTTFMDNIYKVDNLVDTGTQVKVYCNVLSISGISSYPINGLATNGQYFGNYSWGRIQGSRSFTPKAFASYANEGIVGISSSPVVTRVLPFKVDV